MANFGLSSGSPPGQPSLGAPAAYIGNSGRARTILIADDSDSARSIIRTSLLERGFQVCGEAVDGLEAIEKAKALKPDLILLDLAMPRMNGVEAASVLKRELPNVPIVILTVHEAALGGPMGRSLAAAVGAKAAISKHEGMAALVECLTSLIGPA